MGNKHAAGKRILCILLSLAMLLSMMPTAVFAAGSADENSGEDFNPLQYITAEVLFEKIKGSNASMNDITADPDRGQRRAGVFLCYSRSRD